MKLNEKIMLPNKTIPYNVWMLYYQDLINPENLYYINIKPLDALVYKGDFVGFLISQEITSLWMIPLMIINGIKEPDLFDGTLREGRLLFPKVSIINRILKEAKVYVEKEIG